MFNLDLTLLAESFFIPIITLLMGSFAKKLVRGKGWERQDFFFGIELCLSALSGGITLLLDSSINAEITQRAVFFIIITFVFFMNALSLQQDNQEKTPQQEIVWLIGFSNIIGISLMAFFIFWVNSK